MVSKLNYNAILLILLCVLLAFSLFVVFDVDMEIADAGVVPNAYANGENVHYLGESFDYNFSTQTLTLTDADVTICDTYAAYGSTILCYIFAVSDLKLLLVGENTVTAVAGSESVAGLMVDGDLEICGEGSLTINVTGNHDDDVSIYGIIADSVTLTSGSVDVTITDEDDGDAAYGIYTRGGNTVLSESDLTLSVPDTSSNYALYDSENGNCVTLADGKVFASAYGGDNQSSAADLIDNGTVNVALFSSAYKYLSVSIRTRITVKHYVMNTAGQYGNSPTKTEICNDKAGKNLSLASLKDSDLEVTDGIVYDYAKESGITCTTSVVPSDGTMVVELYYERLTYAVGKLEGAGTNFDLNCEDTAYYGQTVYVSNQVVDIARYKDFVLSVTYNNGLTPSAFNADTNTLVMPAAAVNFASSATAQTYNVTLNVYGGAVDADANVTEYTYGTGATLPTVATVKKPNGIFCGWYSDAAFNGDAVTEISESDYGNKTYYAKWHTYELAETSSAENKSSLYTEYGFDEAVVFKCGMTSGADYDYQNNVDFKAELTSSESVVAVYSPALYVGDVKQPADERQYTLKIRVNTDKHQVKVLVVENDSIVVKAANVTGGYAIFTVNGLNDVALIGASVETTPTVQAPTPDGDKPDLLWLYILLPCLAVALSGVAVFVIRKKRKSI